MNPSIVARYDEKPHCSRLLWMVRVCRFDALVEDVLAAPGAVRLVGVDGCAGAGKTTFAEHLAAAAGGAPVVHTDDFASHDDLLGWWSVMRDEVVGPLLAGRSASFRPYDWLRRTRGPLVTVEPAPLVVVEGVAATRAAWRDELALRVWLDVPREVRLRRGLERDGPELAAFWAEWMQAEDGYVAAEHPDAAADLVVDGAAAVPHDPRREFVAVRAAPVVRTGRTAAAARRGRGSPPRR